MTDLISTNQRGEMQYGPLKRRATSPVDRSRVVSRRRLDPLTPEDYLSNDEQRALDELTIKAIRVYRGTTFDPVHSLKSYIRVCDELEHGGSDRAHTRQLLNSREEIELLMDMQKEFTDKDLMVIRNAPTLRRKLLEKLPGKDEKPPVPSHVRSMISPPLTSSQPSSSSPRPVLHPAAAWVSPTDLAIRNSPLRILTPLQISASNRDPPPPHIHAYKQHITTIKHEPDVKTNSPPLPDIALPRSYGPPPPGHGSFQLSSVSPPAATIPSVARPVEPDGPTDSAGRLVPAQAFSTSPYALKPESAEPRPPGTPITAREALASATHQFVGQPSVVASPIGNSPNQPPLPQPSPNTWFIPYHAPGPSGPNPLTFDFPKGTVKYDCPWCDKSYTGANARSVWRRHAQEKHNLPTLLRKRSRWDTEETDSAGGRTIMDKKERNLASKRQWAKDNRRKRKIIDEMATLAPDDPYRQQLQTQLEGMSKRHKAWEIQWIRDGEELPDMPASDEDEDDSDDDIIELPGPPSVMAQPTEPHITHPMSFKIPSGVDSSPITNPYQRPSTVWHPLSAPASAQKQDVYTSSSGGDSSRRPSMVSAPDGERKHSIGGHSGYSADATSPPDGASSGEDVPKAGSGDREYPEMPPGKRRRKKPGEWVIKTGIDRCDLCQRRRVAECAIGPHKKACILCAKKKVQCGWSLSEAANGRLPPGPFTATLQARVREFALRERAAPWPEAGSHHARDEDMDYTYPSDEEETPMVRPRLGPISPLADRSTLLRLDAAEPPPMRAPQQASVPVDIRDSHSRGSSVFTADNEIVEYTGAARCKGCIEDSLEECVVEHRVCNACYAKGRRCEWKVAEKHRSPVDPDATPIATTSAPIPQNSASRSSPLELEVVPRTTDRTTSVVLRQVIQLAEELRADKVRDEDVLELMTRILRTKKGFKPGLVEWLEEDPALYKERLLLLIEEMQEKYVNREKGTLGDCMERDRRRHGEPVASLPVMPAVPILPAMPVPRATPSLSPAFGMSGSFGMPALNTPRDGAPARIIEEASAPPGPTPASASPVQPIVQAPVPVEERVAGIKLEDATVPVGPATGRTAQQPTPNRPAEEVTRAAPVAEGTEDTVTHAEPLEEPVDEPAAMK